MEKLLGSESKLKQALLALELERAALLQAMEGLRGQPGGPDPTQLQPTGD